MAFKRSLISPPLVDEINGASLKFAGLEVSLFGALFALLKEQECVNRIRQRLEPSEKNNELRALFAICWRQLGRKTRKEFRARWLDVYQNKNYLSSLHQTWAEDAIIDDDNLDPRCREHAPKDYDLFVRVFSEIRDRDESSFTDAFRSHWSEISKGSRPKLLALWFRFIQCAGYEVKEIGRRYFVTAESGGIPEPI